MTHVCDYVLFNPASWPLRLPLQGVTVDQRLEVEGGGDLPPYTLQAMQPRLLDIWKPLFCKDLQASSPGLNRYSASAIGMHDFTTTQIMATPMQAPGERWLIRGHLKIAQRNLKAASTTIRKMAKCNHTGHSDETNQRLQRASRNRIRLDPNWNCDPKHPINQPYETHKCLGKADRIINGPEAFIERSFYNLRFAFETAIFLEALLSDLNMGWRRR
jgi:hypothetical protein